MSGLRALVTGGCAGWVGRGCVYDRAGRCRVLAGERCGAFEAGVLPQGTRKQQEGYAAATGVVRDLRKCDCGRVLRARRRLCDECREARRKAGSRERVRRHRLNRRTVTS